MGFKLYCQSGNKSNYIRFVDSANAYIDTSSRKSEIFLDSIPEPVDKYISGRLTDYYNIRALIHDDYGQYGQSYQSYILAYKNAENEKNYLVGGTACLELFSNIYFTQRDTTGVDYLKKARDFYEKANYANGYMEIEQMQAYVKYLDGDYEKCNKLLLKNLEVYKNAKDDQYFYLFATYMLTGNYVELGDLKNAYHYFNQFKSIKTDPTIVQYNYFSFEASLNIGFGEFYLMKKNRDSATFYLSKATKLRNYMNSDLIRPYYNLNADVYKAYGNPDITRVYLDSLAILEKKMYKNLVDTSLQINTPLLNAHTELEAESTKKFWNGTLALVLFFILAAFTIFYVIYYKKSKNRLYASLNKVDNLSYLKSNNEKLTGKVLGLEEYIKHLKKEVKHISTLHDVSFQREKIKELYKNLHFNSSTLLDKSENHLELVNELNVDFFNQLKLLYPQLNDSELITCYYLFMDFKNKEIAVFLNISIRALESRRYRISKKINLDTEHTTLVHHLKSIFKDLKQA